MAQHATHIGRAWIPTAHLEDVHERSADRDGRVERATGDAADSEGTRGHREADGPAVERVALRAFGGGHIQDDEDQREGEQELGQQRSDLRFVARGLSLRHMADGAGAVRADHGSDPGGRDAW